MGGGPVYIPPFSPQPASWPGTPFAKARRMGHPSFWVGEGWATGDSLKTGECAGHLRRNLDRAVVWGGEGWTGFFDDGWRRAGVWTLGEFGGGEEFGVAGGAVARTQEVEETLLADGDVSGGSC